MYKQLYIKEIGKHWLPDWAGNLAQSGNPASTALMMPLVKLFTPEFPFPEKSREIPSVTAPRPCNFPAPLMVV